LPSFVADLLRPGVALRDAGDGVWSAFGSAAPEQRYDRRAALYDAVVGSRVYNRAFWGSSPATYAAFARRAVQSDAGVMLDAGCGSLVFSAAAYAASRRPTVLVDRSLGMLRKAHARLTTAGRPSAPVAFLQADIRDLPFRKASLSTVLCMGMLHLFEDLDVVLAGLSVMASPAGQLFATSLVADRWLGRRYLALLHAAGEVATPRTFTDVRAAIERVRRPVESTREGNMAFFVARAARETSSRQPLMPGTAGAIITP
jgi:ubiquinone/menaquinone biosynthesis C-methylase UbiE